VAAAEQLLERVIADSHEVTEGGEFLPLGVWGVRGFDIEAIRSCTPQEDRKTDRVLGEVYRVRVLQTRRTQVTRNQRTHRLTVPLAPPPHQVAIDDAATAAAATATAVAVAAAALAIEDGAPSEEQPSSNSNSSSSSSSSSSHDKKKKKSKKGAKKTKKGTKKSKKHKKQKKDKKDESRQARTHTDVASLSFL
jgi:cobalamin biosynthesis Mg chelatase CobN